jgi:hypothetical protein
MWDPSFEPNGARRSPAPDPRHPFDQRIKDEARIRANGNDNQRKPKPASTKKAAHIEAPLTAGVTAPTSNVRP